MSAKQHNLGFTLTNLLLPADRTSLSFRLYPSGEFSATRIKTVPKLFPDMPKENCDRSLLFSDQSYSRGQVSDSLRAEIIASTLGLSNVSNSHTVPKARGRKGMTKYNRRLVVNAAILLEKKYGKENLSFLTLTLPEECASRSPDLYAEAKRQMLQWLQRALVRCGLPPLVVGATEIQSGRLVASNQFALHEHWIFAGRSRGKTWALRPEIFAASWSRILGNVYALADVSGAISSSTRVERIRKSAAAYLGKYLSKGEKCVSELIAAGYEAFLPSSWVTRSRGILELFLSAIVKIVGTRATFLTDSLRAFRNIFCKWSKDLILNFPDGGSAWIGFIGFLNQDGHAMFALTGT